MRRGPLVVALLCAVPFLLCSGEKPDEALGRKLGKTQKVESWGYSIRVPDTWISVPAKPGETKTVGGWNPDMERAEKRWDIASVGCELAIFRFAVRGAVTGSRAKEEEDKANVVLGRYMTPEQAGSLDEFLNARYAGRFSPEEFVAGRGKSKLKGELLEFTTGQQFICAARFRKDNFDWLVFYAAPEQYYEKEWRKLYIQSLKTFKLFEPTDQPVLAAPGVDKSKLSRDELREQIKAGIAGSPGWWAHDTDNYVFLTNSKKKSFIKQLGREIEIIRREVYEEFFPPSKKVEAISIVRVFATQNEYYGYGGSRGSAGYWNSAKEELVLFDNFSGMSKSKSTAFTKSVLYHEAFHQYIYYAVGDVAPHSWFNEGHGDYFAGHAIRGKRVSAKPFDWRVDYLKRHLALDKGLIPIRSLVRLPQSEYYSNAGLKYAQGWALIFFLREVTDEDSWRDIPNRYFEHLRDNVAAFQKKEKDKDDDSGEQVPGIPSVKVYSFADRNRVEKILEEAVDVGFEGVDVDELQEQFERWIRSIT